MNELLDLNSISFGALFVWLLYNTNKSNEIREEKYQETIATLGENLKVVNDIKKMIENNKEVKENE